MKLLQPEMAKLREKFGDDKQRLNQEMMALYKRVGANPMAGCLPIAIQIPVFFSLYKVLYVTIEMRHAPFYGWIHDLSAPDPTSFVNLFGLLPFTPPDFSLPAYRRLAAHHGLTMFLQQKLNPQPPDPMQAKMFMILPVVFTFMLAPFAGRAGDLLELEQPALDRAAMGDHAPRRRDPAGQDLSPLYPPEPAPDAAQIEAGRRLFAQECRFVAAAANEDDAAARHACRRSPSSAAPMSASRASSTR